MAVRVGVQAGWMVGWMEHEVVPEGVEAEEAAAVIRVVGGVAVMMARDVAI